MVMDDVQPSQLITQQIEEAERIAQEALTRAAVLRQQHNVPASKAKAAPSGAHLEPQ